MRSRMILMWFFFFAGTALAQGTSGRGGGHETGLEFTNVFAASIEEIRQNQPDVWAMVRANCLTELTPEVRIFADSKQILVDAGDGEQDSVAANDPETKRIWINSDRWDKVIHPRIRQAIALHEVCSLTRFEKTGYYPASGAFLAKFDLRNDKVVFLTGQDPSLPQWKSRRVSCERRHALKNEETGQILNRSDFSLYAQAEWAILDRIYSLQFVFASETGGNWPNPINVPSFIQRVQTTVTKNGKETLLKLSGQSLTVQKNEFTVDISPERYLLTEQLSADKLAVWDWTGSNKGEKSKLITETTLSDGSTRRVTDDLKALYIKPIRMVEAKIDCVEKFVPGEEWLALAGQKDMGAAVEKLNTRALMVYEANRALKGCASDCAGLKTEVELQHEKFIETWNGIFLEQQQRLKSKYKQVKLKPLPK